MQSRLVTKLNTRMLTKVGLLSSITIIMGASGIGFIQLPLLKLTIMHIPVIIGAMLEGPLAGALIGLMFGLFSLFQNIVAPTWLSFAMLNPLVSVLPRILIGIVAYYVYKLISRLNKTAGVAVGAIAGSLTNTVGVLFMIYILYIDKYAAGKNITIDKAIDALLGIAASNGVFEAILAAVVSVPVVYAIWRTRKDK